MNTENDEKNKHLRNWLVQKLRRISYMWPARKAALKKARLTRGIYKCAHCEKTFGPRQINVDHIHPVVSVSGWDDWNGFIGRLFCDEDGFQILCADQCHATKTQLENGIRFKEKSTKKTRLKNKKLARNKSRKGKRK